MHRIIISDTSCLILLEKLELLDVLQKLFGEITITEEIAREFGSDLPGFISIAAPLNRNYQMILEGFLDSGEASAIALAIENQGSLLILDDQKARKEAKRLGLKLTGTIGVLILAINRGFISSSDNLIEKIKQSDFRIAEKYLQTIIEKTQP